MANTDPTGYISIPPDLMRGVAWKPPARMATTANISLTGLQTIDGIVGAADDVVLVKDQTAGSGNGLYLMKTGAWVRHFSMDQDLTTSVAANEVLGAAVQVIAGTVNGGTFWRVTNTATPILGTTAIVWAQIATTDLSGIDFLVGTASALLSGEIVVGTTPGGELGNTWASPTVDTTHSGSSHAATQAAAEATAAAALAAHAAAAGSGTTDHVHIGGVTFSGDAVATAFELPAAPFDAYSIDAYVAGTRTEVTLSGTMLTTMTFAAAPASGTDNIKVHIVAVAV